MLDFILNLVVQVILYGIAVAVLLVWYLVYYSYKALRHVLRYIHSKIGERRGKAPPRLRYDKYTNHLEEF
jgi:F0F1-type ATP synthase membrane subunit b/b'